MERRVGIIPPFGQANLLARLIFGTCVTFYSSFAPYFLDCWLYCRPQHVCDAMRRARRLVLSFWNLVQPIGDSTSVCIPEDW
jgi:hypothetical protein